MKSKAVAIYALTAMLAVAPVSSAFAYDHHRNHWGHGGPLFGLVALGTAVVVGAATIVSAPFNAIADAGPPPYAPPQGYYNNAPGYYAQAQPYYAPQRVVYSQPYYAPQPYYAAPQPYYAPAPGYYYR